MAFAFASSSALAFAFASSSALAFAAFASSSAFAFAAFASSSALAFAAFASSSALAFAAFASSSALAFAFASSSALAFAAFASSSAFALALASSSARALAACSASAFASASNPDRSTVTEAPGNIRSRSPASVRCSSFSRDSSRDAFRGLISPAMIAAGTTGDSAPVSMPTVRGTSAAQSTSTTAWPLGSVVRLCFLPLCLCLPPPTSPEPSRTIGVATTPAPPTSHSSRASIARWVVRLRPLSRRRRMPTCAARSAMRSVSNTRYGLSSSASATVRWPSNSRITPWTSVGSAFAYEASTSPSIS